jgi:hypothetical protein
MLRALLPLALAALSAVSCGRDHIADDARELLDGPRAGVAACVLHPPCPATIAVVVNLAVEGAPGPVAGGFVQVGSGSATSTLPCQTKDAKTSCFVPGGGGTYPIEVGAPGFDSVRRTVIVEETPAEPCQCSIVHVQYLDLALARSH